MEDMESLVMVDKAPAITIKEAISKFITKIRNSRSENTERTYKNALDSFLFVLSVHRISNDEDIKNLPDTAFVRFMTYLMKEYSPSTQNLYLTVVISFYRFLSSENLSEPDLTFINEMMKDRISRFHSWFPDSPSVDNIEKILSFLYDRVSSANSDENEHLRNLRDLAFLLTLADTGLRVHEACNLRRGDIDWNEGKAIIIGKGDREAVVRFSKRSLKALQDYLHARAKLDGASGRPLPSLPLFARHDKGAGTKVKRISTRTGQYIVDQRVAESIGPEPVGTITPHSFRHYFVTTVLRASGNLKLAQELARHRNIAVTQRYAHLSDDELDQGYHKIFEDN